MSRASQPSGVTAERDGWGQLIVDVGDIHTAESFPDSVSGRRRPPVRSENPGVRIDAVEAWCAESPCDSVAWGPVEPLIAASSAQARLILGRFPPGDR